MRVPLVDLRAQHRSIEAEVWPAVRALVERQEFILGEAVAEFERTLAEICGVAHAVGVASGTDALRLALVGLGIGAGDAVVIPAVSFVATAESVVSCGARPIFADVEGFVLTPGTLERALAPLRRRPDGSLEEATTGARVRGVLPVHLFGECAPMEGIRELAARHRMLLLEDAAQAIGAKRGGTPVGGLGDAAAFSFFPTKNLGAWGDGGAIVTRDPALAARVRELRAHGGPTHERLGTNSRLDALQATVLLAKARHLEGWVRARGAAAARYRELLAPLGTLAHLPNDRPGDRHAYHQFVLRTDRRDALIAHLASQGIEARAYYPRPLHHEPCLAPFVPPGLSLPGAEEAARSAVAIPMFAEITPEQQAEVARAIREFFAIA